MLHVQLTHKFDITVHCSKIFTIKPVSLFRIYNTGSSLFGFLASYRRLQDSKFRQPPPVQVDGIKGCQRVHKGDKKEKME